MGDDATTTDDYKVTITPTPNVAMAATDVVFTVTATDESDNSGSDTATATLAAREEPGDETDPVVTVTAPSGLQSAAFDLMITVVEENLPAAAPYGITVTGAPDAATGMYTIGAVMMGDDATTTDDYKVTITPTADVDMAATDVVFTVTATDDSDNSGSDTATATLAERMAPADDPEPTFPATATIGDQVYWVDEAGITIRLPEAEDDKPTDPETHQDRYTVDPALPDGLGIIFIGSTQYIAGTPSTAQAKTAYKWVYTDAAGGTAELAFSLTVLARVVPGKVMGLTAEQDSHDPTEESVDLMWNALAKRTKADADNSGNDGGSPVTHYMIKWTGMASGSMSTADEDDPDAVMYTLMQDLEIGEYEFQVAAVNAIGMGAYSDEVAVNVANPPSVPRDLDASLEQVSNRVTLNWLAPYSDGGDAITGYAVYIWAPGSTAPTRHPTGSTATTYRTDTLTVEGRYSFRVAAINGCGEGPQSAVDEEDVDILVNKPPVFQPGAAISNIVATVGTPVSVPLPTASDPEGEDVFYAVQPRLPAGLRISLVGASPAIVGTPTTATATALHSFIAADIEPAVSDPTISTLPFYITVHDSIPPTALIDSTISLPALSIPAHGFVVLQRNPGDSGIYAQVRDTVVGLANLDHLFRDRGGIALRGPGTARDLVFSEIMWGSDSSLADDTHSQWIELYNTTSGTLQLSNYTLEFYSARIPATPGAIDEINTSAWGDIHGQRGRTSGVDTQGRFSEPVEIISMYRKINYARVEHPQARGEQLKDFPNGSNHGHWAASTRPSLNIAATWRLATPGTRPRYTIHGASSVRRHVIISEVGNSGTNAYDWFELYNTTDGEINLKKWQLSYVTDDGGKGKEVAVLQFPDNDNIKIPAKSYLVIAASNPKNDGNDLAAGIDITKGAVDQVPRGLGERGSSTVAHYAVLGFSLPNDAKRSLLILRTGHGNLGKAAGLEDVIGTLSIKLQGPVPSDWTGYDANNTVYYNTSLWPLHATGGPHGNVIDGGDEDFRAGKVYQRNNFGGGTGEKHLAIRGYTGIGYDRHAAVNAENGGTPGYSKDAVKGDKSNWAGQVSISEIMLVTEEGEGAGRVPRATRLPQWFEIYNASLTEAVSINNWYLEIQNDDTPDFLANLHGTLRLPNVIIQPNQTVLVVSGSGLNSGHFPEQRTINVFTNGTYRQILGLTRRGEPMLNPEGFYIELRDQKNNPVDEIGNLGVSRRTGAGRRDNFGEQWEMPPLHSPDGHRTSMIRIYDNGSARSGLNPVGGPEDRDTSWVLASNTNFRNVPSLTYYGNHRDFGTPGYRGGGPLPVSLSKFRPERLESGEVVIRWATESELNNAGFNILRSDTRDGEYTQLNTQLIAGKGTTSEQTTYEWKDTTAKPNVVYYYQIQDVSLDGQVQTLRTSRLKGNVTPAGKATTTWGELKALQ